MKQSGGINLLHEGAKTEQNLLCETAEMEEFFDIQKTLVGNLEIGPSVSAESHDKFSTINFISQFSYSS